MTTLNLDDPYVYENIVMVINEFEKQSLESSTREGILAVAQGPLEALEGIMDSSSTTLHGIRDARESLQNPPEAGVSTREERESGNGGMDLTVDWDQDLLEFLPDPNEIVGEGAAGRSAQEYIEECIGCSLRLSFDFQMQPIMQNGSINDFLDQVDGMLDRFAAMLDPLNPRMMRQLCWALDHLRGLCIPDLIMILMALKMLMRKYLTNTLNIKLDWTNLLGPVLRAIMQGISLLLDNLAGIVLAPLECSLDGMRTANRLLREIDSVVATAQSIGEAGKFKENFESGEYDIDASLIFNDLQWSPDPDVGDKNLASNTTPESVNPPAVSGFEINADLTVEEALKDSSFMEGTFLDKLIVAVQDAVAWLRGLVESITDAFDNLGNLVGGGISANMDNLGVMLFIFDMIALVQMIIRLLRSNRNVNDWCALLQDNPEILETELRSRFGDVSVESSADSSELVLRRGPDIVGSVKTCVSARTDIDQQVLNQWIADLLGGGNGNGS